ncbi:bifunctional aminoglycoside phosphotransferase/ATP-binding protein [Futiania mangrovi]|uniref:AAA family ATPase n=1 Tax=Futiania mangrovi TaxID=2959716 RepID=A0A9J6PE42_9PROT|nr:bifunctional aminoglycoside phosphotransferase/ATP-binding protein [Futiania mangrovii]MCP1336937.1 AAA family ATPase [Futiania mangrovii]
MTAAEQAETVRFLETAAFPGAAVTRIDTHLSHVFLTPTRAWKMKRAVHFPFADFTTVEQRRAAIAREFEINRRTAPALYLGVHPVTRMGDRLALDGPGTPVDWLLEMVRFTDADRLDRVLEDGRLTPALLAALADRVAQAHLAAPRAGKVQPVSQTVAGVAGGLLENPATRGDTHARAWCEGAEATAKALGPWLAARARQGFARACHGDLHLGNLCLFEGEPTPFDAIEFNRALTDIDVLYDLAFLLMDLWFRGHRGDAARILSRYLSATRDYRGLRALPLFISLRAAVRAMVLGLGDSPKEEEAHAYARFAADVLAAPATPRLFAVGGLSGTGKSTLAATLAPHAGGVPGAVVISSDVTRKRLWGVAPETRLPPEAYAETVSDAVRARMMQDAARALAAGHPAILDATFLRPSWRDAAAAVATRAGVPFAPLWLEAAGDTLRTRIAARTGDASDATVTVLERQMETGEPPANWPHLDAGAQPDTRLAAACAAAGLRVPAA